MEAVDQLVLLDEGMSSNLLHHMILFVDHMTSLVDHMTPHPPRFHQPVLQSVLFSLLLSVSLSLSPLQPHTHHTVHINNHQGNPTIW